MKTNRLVIIGHRGARGLAAENTLASFQKALEYHVDQLEFDLRVTQDNIVVLNHDPFLNNSAGKKLLMNSQPYRALLAQKPDLLTFEQLLDFIGPNKTHLLVEIKPHEPVEPIAAIIEQRLAAGWPPGQFSIGSFYQPILRGMHQRFPEIEMVVIERWSGVRAFFRAKQVDTKRLNMRSWWLWKGFLHTMHKRGYQLSPYTMNDPRKVQKWRQAGLFGVITDRPDRFSRH
jgi:glycerophosphoryl diester phosphodiesterase